MRVTHPNWQHRLLVVGLAWLLILFVVGVIAANHPSLDEVPVQLQAQSGAEVDASGRVLVLPGDSSGEALATLRFVLPAPDPASSRWVVWMGRDPVESLWLEARGWHSRSRHFFNPTRDEGVLPGGFVLPLPGDWQGEISLVLHARAATQVALRPRVLHETAALQLGRRGVALESAIYAGLFVLALLSLALYSAARDRSFLALFVCACAALLLLAAENGHLYQLPGFALLSAWRAAGLWALGLLFATSALQVLLRYAGLRGRLGAKRWLDRYCFVLVAVAALCLLHLRALDAWLPALVALVLLGAAGGALALLGAALRRHVPLATTMLLLVLLTLTTGVARVALAHGWLLDLSWARYGYQLSLVITMALLMVGLLTRIGEFRHQRDRDQLARIDSERRLAREAARADLTLALQTRLRSSETTDIEWVAFRLLLEQLAPQLPVEWAAVVAYGYHGRDVLVVEPPALKQRVHELVAARSLALKRLAAQGLPVQQAAVSDGAPCIEALVPLSIRSPGWGLLLLQRAGSDGFSTEEMVLAGEFARLATLQADESQAAAQLRRSAELDALTGTFNRRSMDQWLVRAFLDTYRHRRPLSLLFIDIDHFKSVNDRLGHAAGDHCLREVASALRGALETGDMLGRYGGEEFVVLLPGRGGAEAREMGERLRAAVERCEFRHEGHVERLTVSIGVATRLDREDTPTEAVKRADQALYAAKRGGRNRVHVAPAVFT
jgi:diguanylate cyclase (GGDEF)-like protein